MDSMAYHAVTENCSAVRRLRAHPLLGISGYEDDQVAGAHELLLYGNSLLGADVVHHIRSGLMHRSKPRPIQ
jgi:hypothetical protein